MQLTGERRVNSTGDIIKRPAWYFAAQHSSRNGVNARQTRIALPPVWTYRTAEVWCTASSHDVARQVLMSPRLTSGRLLCSARARNAIHYQFNEARAEVCSAPRRLLFNSAGNSTGNCAESYTWNASRVNCFLVIFDLYMLIDRMVE